MLVQFFRKEPARDVKVFVMIGGQPASVLLRGLGRTARGRGVLRDFEFARAQHYEERFLAPQTPLGMTDLQNWTGQKFTAGRLV